jgi:hypothetical protein
LFGFEVVFDLGPRSVYERMWPLLPLRAMTGKALEKTERTSHRGAEAQRLLPYASAPPREVLIDASSRTPNRQYTSSGIHRLRCIGFSSSYECFFDRCGSFTFGRFTDL